MQFPIGKFNVSTRGVPVDGGKFQAVAIVTTDHPDGAPEHKPVTYTGILFDDEVSAAQYAAAEIRKVLEKAP